MDYSSSEQRDFAPVAGFGLKLYLNFASERLGVAGGDSEAAGAHIDSKANTDRPGCLVIGKKDIASSLDTLGGAPVALLRPGLRRPTLYIGRHC